MKETLIVNMDYAGTCAGSCPICALTKEERAMDKPFLNLIQIENAFNQIIEKGYTDTRHLVIGIGRGNTLALGEDIDQKIQSIVQYAENKINFQHGEVEISTSLMGKIDDQIKTAIKIRNKLIEHNHKLDPRFVIVANTQLKSPQYWNHINKFITTMMEERGGGDHSGDILLLNLSLENLPNPKSLIKHLKNYHFPINITWSPTLDNGAKNPENLQKLEKWLVEWFQMIEKYDLDSSLLTRIQDGHKAYGTSMNELIDQINGNGDTLLFIDSKGNLHHGFSCVSADMDPIRFASGAIDPSPNQKLVSDPRKDLFDLMRWPACQGCPHISGCVVSGGHKAALLAIPKLKPDPKICPSGLRSVFQGMLNNA